MNVERLPERITKVLVIVLGTLFAVYCGKLAGSGQMATVVLMLVGMVLLTGLLVLREQIWILIPVCWFLTGRIAILPLPIAVRDLVIIYVAIGTFVLKAFKVIRGRRGFGVLDVLVVALMAYLVLAFVRNPVGFSVANSARVGGRPYYDAAVAFVAYVTLGMATLTPDSARRLPVAVLSVALLLAGINFIARFVPSIVPVLSEYYTGIDSSVYLEQLNSVGGESQRVDSMMEFGKIGILTLCALYRPVTLLMPAYPVRFFLFIVVVAATLASGYRNVVVWGGAVFLLSSYFRNGSRELLRFTVFGLGVLLILIVGHGRVFDLPFAAQRALSIIPNERWDEEAVGNAKATSEWRMEIWREVYFTDRYIRNRFLGDGFGMLRSEYEITQAIAARYYHRSDEDSRLVAALAGDYHSGPLSTLKVVGYLGGISTYFIMFVVLRRAVRVIRRARGTPYESVALFVGLPLIIEPFFFTAIFGGFSLLVPMLFLGVAMLKLVSDAVEAWTAKNGTQDCVPVEPLPSRSLIPHRV